MEFIKPQRGHGMSSGATDFIQGQFETILLFKQNYRVDQNVFEFFKDPF